MKPGQGIRIETVFVDRVGQLCLAATNSTESQSSTAFEDNTYQRNIYIYISQVNVRIIALLPKDSV